MENDKQRTVKGEDNDGNEVVVVVKRPTAQCYNKSQIAYNKAFRQALDSGALLRQKLTDYMKEQGIWDEKKEKQYDALVEEINGMEEEVLRKTYIETLCNGEMSGKGGAGLGLLSLAKKASGPIEYRFDTQEDDRELFTLIVTVRKD